MLELKRRGGTVVPRFAGREEVDLARKVIGIYRRGIGRKLGSVREALKRLENARNYRKVRAFSKIIERGCEFDSVSDLNPAEVRRFLFSKGFVTTLEERRRVIEECAEFFGVDADEIERAMFCDLEEEKVLRSVPEITPEELVKVYNLSLLQTALFNALRMTFFVSTNHKNVFRKVKWLGLMYELYEENGRLTVGITGAASILKMTRKYGTSMAKLVPEIMRAKDWWIRAEILEEHERRIYFLEVSSKLRHLFPVEYEEKVEYDSSLEEEFARRIRFLLDCEVVREPGVVKAGRYAYIPDFLLRKGDKEVYVEIAGFWTEDYVRKKLEKIAQAGIPLVLVVREDLALSKPKGALDVVMIRRGKIPYRELVRKIRSYL